MSHPHWHTACYRCQTQPQQQPQATVQIAADAPPAEVVAQSQGAVVGEAALSMELEEVAICLAVQGPVVADILTLLREVPPPVKLDAGMQKSTKLCELKVELEEARLDVEAAQALSAHIRAAALKRVEDLEKGVEAHLPVLPAAPATYEEADKRRAAAVSARLDWKKRADKKQEGLHLQVTELKKQAQLAVDLILKQIVTVEEAAVSQAQLWTARNEGIEATHAARIKELEDLCKSTAVSATVCGILPSDPGSQEAIVTALQAAVATMQAQLDQQKRCMDAAEHTHAGVLSRLQHAERGQADAVSQLAGFKANAAPPMAPEEASSRAAHANAVVEESSEAAEVKDMGLGKGKGKAQVRGESRY